MGRWFDQLEICERHGCGGRSTVWRAHHRSLGIDVALKVLPRPERCQPEQLGQVEREARLLARLEHPQVVRLYDYGTLDRTFADSLDSELLAGAPYLAMEFIPETLSHRPPTESWVQAQTTLSQVLQALAYTHAHGLIHCDLKPQNLLWTACGVKLSDFGTARWFQSEHTDSRDPGRFGTPTFMAPEQLRNEPIGPTVDLYAVGCLAYWLLQGSPPFSQGSDVDIARGHLSDEPPRLDPVFSTPSDLGGWLAGLLAKSPSSRYACATDALTALAGLARPSTRRWLATMPAASQPRTGPPADAKSASVDTVDLPISAPAHPPLAGPPARAPYVTARAFPRRAWQAPDHSQARRDDQGQAYRGSSLLGLRVPALVGREVERERLWQLLGQVYQEQSSRVAVLTGSSGVGKSRLARWLQERALELGLATGLTATHAPIARAGDGLPGAIAQLLGCHQLSRGASIEHLRRLISTGQSREGLGEQEAAALVDIARQGTPTVTTHPETLTHGDWLSVVGNFLGTLASSRALVVWVDDVQWGTESLSLMEHVLGALSHRPWPILFVATAQTEALLARPLADERLETLMRSPRVCRLHLTPLSRREQTSLLVDLLPSHPRVREQIAERSAGNPLFAIQAALAARDDHNAQQSAEGTADLPEFLIARAPDEAVDMATLWRARLRSFQATHVDSASDTSRIMLLLAVAGSAVSLQELEVTCHPIAAANLHRTLERLLKRGFVSERNLRYSYSYGLLRETLCTQAQQQNQWKELHQQWAEGLEQLYGGRGAWVAERLAYHYFHAGLLEQASSWAPQAAEHCARLGFMDRVRALQRLRHQILDAMGQSQSSVGRAHALLAELRFFTVFEKPEVLDRWLARAHSILLEHPGDELDADFHLSRCHLHRSRENVTAAMADAERALPYYRAAKGGTAAIMLLRYCAELQRKLGNFDAALEHYADAADRCREIEDHFLLSWCSMGMAMAKKGQGLLEEADGLLADAMAGFERAAAASSIACSFNERGELARMRGDLAGARSWYQRALQAAPANHIIVSTMLWNLALTLLQQRKIHEARDKIAQVHAELRLRGREARLVYPDFGSLVCAAHDRQWQQWDHDLARVTKHLLRQVAHADFAICAELAAEECQGADQLGRARAAYELAASQWRALNRDDRASSVDELLLALGSGTQDHA